MRPDRAIHRLALGRLSTNLALGLLPFGFLAGLDPAASVRAALPIWLCGLAALAAAAFLSMGLPTPRPRTAPFRRLLSCLLLGGSLAAIPWSLQCFAFFPVAVITGFVARWWHYLLETRDLRVADRQRLPLPCLATRLRRVITWITGALSPLLVLTGLPAPQLLSLSFLLTVFSQWSSAFELNMKLG